MPDDQLLTRRDGVLRTGVRWLAACLTIGLLPFELGPAVAHAQGTPLVIGVLPFDATRADTALRPLGFAIADLIATDFAMVQRLRVVERLRLGEVLREQQLARTGVVDRTVAPRVGRLMRANRLVAGALVTGASNRLVFEARIVNVESGVVDTALQRATANVADILDAQKQITFGLLGRLGIGLTPRERSVIEQRPTRNLGALLAYGQGVQEEVNGNFAGARRAFRRASTLDPSFRAAVTRLQQTNAIAIRTEGTIVQGVVDVVNPSLPHVPTQPPAGTIVTPGLSLPRGTIVVTISRP
ncbi:MAG: CsgG/HfaB family protein [Gemmatimonadaceae bacterium]